MKEAKLNRNSLCWCGSGKKYKKCHMLEDQTQNKTKKIIPRSKEFIEGMKKASIPASNCLSILEQSIQAGITTNKLNQIAHEYLLDNNAKPASLGYQGFPKSICTSINSVICHGIPSEETLADGDIISIDVACSLDNYYGDTCKTFSVGNCSPQALKLIQVTKECLQLGIEAVQPYSSTYHIGAAIEEHAQKNGFSVVEKFIGHGIGTNFHEELQILHYKQEGYGTTILPGMFFTIEPMINEGVKEVQILDDNWTATTLDGKLSAQFEHTIMITENRTVQILT